MDLPPPGHRASSPSSKSKKRDPHDRDDNSSGAEEFRPWADITEPLLDMLLPRVSHCERVLLSSVCRQWHDFIADHPFVPPPRLLLPEIEMKDTNEVRVMECKASSHGWLYLSDTREPVQGFLINPLSKARIDLPTCPSYVIHAAFSAPTEPDCMVLNLTRGDFLTWDGPCPWIIYHCHVNDETWHAQTAQFTLRSNIAVVGRRFYFLCEEGLAEIDCSGGGLLTWLKLNEGMLPRQHECPSNHWLVESNGELLIVTLLQAGDKFVASVCKADYPNKIWAGADNLGGRSLFLSERACLSLPDVYARSGHGGSVYHLREYMVRTWKSLGQYNYSIVNSDEDSNFSCYLWFSPDISIRPRKVVCRVGS